jgi:gas vesicle protein
MSNSSKMAMALLAGLVAGAALGVWVAPGQGRENRASLCDSMDDLRFSLSECTNDELWKFLKWRGRVISYAKALVNGPEPEMPDDLEHA